MSKLFRCRFTTVTKCCWAASRRRRRAGVRNTVKLIILMPRSAAETHNIITESWTMLTSDDVHRTVHRWGLYIERINDFRLLAWLMKRSMRTAIWTCDVIRLYLYVYVNSTVHLNCNSPEIESAYSRTLVECHDRCSCNLHIHFRPRDESQMKGSSVRY